FKNLLSRKNQQISIASGPLGHEDGIPELKGARRAEDLVSLTRSDKNGNSLVGIRKEVVRQQLDDNKSNSVFSEARARQVERAITRQIGGGKYDRRNELYNLRGFRRKSVAQEARDFAVNHIHGDVGYQSNEDVNKYYSSRKNAH